MNHIKCRDFKSTGNISLPKKWREQLQMFPGSLVDLIYVNRRIIIKKHGNQTTDNTRILGDDGLINIPIELRKRLSIQEEKEFCLYFDAENSCFIFFPDVQESSI